ncbi:MAG TPA: NAD(P)H-hydrate epimerase, partial [Chitinophagales bacterium]|nr:NAD(P)H-hydrate epimerase [Chitinophagales bacterium]
MIIPDAHQIKQLDAATIVAQNIRSSDLMERAAKGITNYLLHDNPHFEFFIINCGTGNNGGDGLCIARQLLQAGKKVKVNICGNVQKSSADFALNFQRLQTQFPLAIHIISSAETIPSFDCDCLLDCLFGTGLNKSITGLPALIIEKMNAADAIILAVDIPSGLQSNSASVEPIVKADCTISFEYPKLAFLFPENAKYVGQWMIQNIGLIDTQRAGLHQHLHFVTADDIQSLFSERPVFAHKGSFGHVLTIGGRVGMEGAATMSGLAALKTGAGLSTITSSQLQNEHPEIMFTAFENI